MYIKNNDESKTYIIGVTIPRVENELGMLLRFIRISFVLPLIQKMVKDLKSYKGVNEACINNNSRENLTDRLNKRPKF